MQGTPSPAGAQGTQSGGLVILASSYFLYMALKAGCKELQKFILGLQCILYGSKTLQSAYLKQTGDTHGSNTFLRSSNSRNITRSPCRSRHTRLAPGPNTRARIYRRHM